MESDFKPPSLDFGILIAFVAPGFVAFWAASYHIPMATAWMTAASDKEQNVGIFLFVVLTSLSLGLVISGVRALVFDRLLRCGLLGKLAIRQLKLDWSKIDEKKLPLLLTIRDNHYRYYQFYSNTLTAFILWVLARAFANATPLSWPFWALSATASVALLLAARESLDKYVVAVDQLIA